MPRNTHIKAKAKSLAAVKMVTPTQWSTGVTGHYSGAMSQCWQIHLGEGWYSAGGAVPCSG